MWGVLHLAQYLRCNASNVRISRLRWLSRRYADHLLYEPVVLWM